MSGEGRGGLTYAAAVHVYRWCRPPTRRRAWTAADPAGRRSHVEVISTVSGGSILGGLYCLEVKSLLENKADDEITQHDYIPARGLGAGYLLAEAQMRAQNKVTSRFPAPSQAVEHGWLFRWILPELKAPAAKLIRELNTGRQRVREDGSAPDPSSRRLAALAGSGAGASRIGR